MFQRSRSLLSILALGLTFALASPATAGTIEHDGWLYGEKADKAIELAIEHNVPIAVMRTFRTTSCPKCLGAARQMVASKSTEKMVRVMVYVDGGDELKSEAAAKLVNKAYGQTKDPSGWIPDLYFVMPDGRALGFVPYEDAASTESEAKAVVQMAAWINGVEDELAKADRDVERGRFSSAIQDIEQLEEQDAKVEHMVRIQLGLIDKKAEMPETPENPFFPGLKDEKIAEYKAKALEMVAEARALVEKDELREAQRLLRTLSRVPDDFQAKAKAQTLMDEVVEKLRAK